MSEINKVYKKYGQNTGKQFLTLFYSFHIATSNLYEQDRAVYKSRFDDYVKKEYGNDFFNSYCYFARANESNQKLMKELEKYRTVYASRVIADLAKEPPKQEVNKTSSGNTSTGSDKSIKQQPQFYEQLNKATIYLDGNQMDIDYNYPDKAIPIVQSAIFLQPHNADNWCVLGDLYSKQKEWGEAYICYGKALLKDPKSTRALHGKYNIEQQNKGQQAVESIPSPAKPVVPVPQDKKQKVDEETFYFENEKEFIIYCKVSQTDKNVVWAKGSNYLDEYQKGYRYIDQKQYSQAVDAFQHALKLNPVGLAARFELCTAYTQMHDLPAARAALKDAEPYMYSDQLIAKYYRCLGYILIEEKQYKLAANVYQYSLFLDPDQQMAKQELLFIVNEAGFEVLDGISDRRKVEKTLQDAKIPLLKNVME